MRNKIGIILLVLLLVPNLLLVPQALADGNDPVRITSQNMIVFPVDEQSVQIVHVAAFKNNGTEKEAEMPIFLPSGYSGLELREGITEATMKQIEKGIVDTTGLESGEEKRIVLSYYMPMEKDLSRWSIEQSYLTESIQVVIPAGVMSFEAPDLVTQSERLEMNGREFRRFTRVDLHPGEPWRLTFHMLTPEESQEPAAGQEQVNLKVDENYTNDGKKIYGHEHGGGYFKAVITLIIVLLALSIALIGLKRDQNTHKKDDSKRRPWLKDEKALLFQQIGRLEQDYAAELISEETYQASRKQLRDQLIRISAELQRESV
jgi:hypothetical protein